METELLNKVSKFFVLYFANFDAIDIESEFWNKITASTFSK